MGNEAVLVVKTEGAVDWIVVDTAGIEKGTFMEISGSSTIGRTAISGSGTGIFAGITRREKLANDGRTRAALFRGGIFKCVMIGAGSAGAAVRLSGSNLLGKIVAADDDITGVKVGTVLEDYADGETKEVWIGR